MLARQRQPEPPLHGGDEADRGLLGQDALHEPQVRRVVLDVEDRAPARGVARRRRARRVQAGARVGRHRLGQLDPEEAAPALRVVETDGAAHRLHEPLGEREPEPGALDGTRLGAEAVERREEPRAPVVRNARARVGDRETDPADGHLVTADDEAAGLVVVLDRIGDQVQQHLLQPLGVREHVAMVERAAGDLDVDAPLGGERTGQVHDAGDGLADLDGLLREREPPGLDARDVEDLVDQLQQVPAALEDLLHALAVGSAVGLHLEELPEAEDRVERRPQLVAHAREELTLRLVGAVRLGLGLRELVGALAHALLELFGIALHLLVEARLGDGDGQLGGRLLRDLDLLVGELSARAAEAQ